MSPASKAADSARGAPTALPDARVVILPGQQRTAMYTAPELFVSEVARLLEE